MVTTAPFHQDLFLSYSDETDDTSAGAAAAPEDAAPVAAPAPEDVRFPTLPVPHILSVVTKDIASPCHQLFSMGTPDLVF